MSHRGAQSGPGPKCWRLMGVKLGGSVCSYLFQPPYLSLSAVVRPKNRFSCSFLAAHFYPHPSQGSSFTPSGLVFIFCLFNTDLQSLLNFIVLSFCFCLFRSALIPVTSMINFVCILTLIVGVQSEAGETTSPPVNWSVWRLMMQLLHDVVSRSQISSLM